MTRWDEIFVPIACFAVIGMYHAYEFNSRFTARKFFRSVRKGWVTENFLKGQQAVNTTRDYVRVSLFYGNTAILVATFAAGFAGNVYRDCSAKEGGCSAASILLLIKFAVVTGYHLTSFFIFAQCTRCVCWRGDAACCKLNSV